MIPIVDTVVDPEVRARAVARYRERGIVLPTFAQMRDPSLVPENVRDRLRGIGLWDLDPLNLFRITWKNEPRETGGLYGDVNAIELPPALTGVDARIVALVGKWFPTGAHKVGAAYGCLAPVIVSGGFDPTFHKAVWPSTGNYCRGGAFDSYLMDCTAVAILPEEMSRERFDWLRDIGAEVIATPGCESNVKEIYDKCWELRRTRDDVVIFNQFSEFGNAVWHYHCTGAALEELHARPAATSRPTSRPPARPAPSRPATTCAPSPPAEGGRVGGAAVPHPAAERLRRPPHRGHRRQARALDPQRAQHRRRRGHRRRRLHAPVAPVQRAGGPRGAGGRGRAHGTIDQLACWASRAWATCWPPSRPPAGSSTPATTSSSPWRPTRWTCTARG